MDLIPAFAKQTVLHASRKTATFLAAVGFLALAAGCAHPPARDMRVVYGERTLADEAHHRIEGRAIWVTRWDYKTPKDIRHIIDNCARFHFNMVFFQVRGNATAFYRSSLEPWAWELTSDGPETTGMDPGFDPLQVAIDRARKRGVELHAYMNVFPGWRSQDYPPPSSGQVWVAHPDWFMCDRMGRKMIPRDHNVDPKVGTWYSFLNPANPAVQEHVVAVFREVAERYDVDGIHFDYVRYPHEIGDFSYDPVSIKRYKEEEGQDPGETPALWTRWRGEQVNAVVSDIEETCKAVAPQLIISASVGRDLDRSRDQLMQCTEEWMSAKWIDMACPMIYTTDNATVAQSVTQFKRRAHGRVFLAGLMVTDDPRHVLDQIGVARISGAQGVSLFSYEKLFPEHKANAVARALLEGPFENRAAVPLPPTTKEIDRGVESVLGPAPVEPER